MQNISRSKSFGKFVLIVAVHGKFVFKELVRIIKTSLKITNIVLFSQNYLDPHNFFPLLIKYVQFSFAHT